MPPPRKKALPVKKNGIFVNRDASKRIFEDAVFSIPQNGSIIRVFYGAGGQGKTALCRELFRATSHDADPAYGFLKRAELDLHGRPNFDPDRLLVWIRNGFAKAGVAFPTFDLTLAIIWQATRGDEAFPRLENAWLGKSTEALVDVAPESVQTLRETVEKSVETIPGLGNLITKGGRWVIDKAKRAYLERTRESLKELYHQGELKKSYELSELLPWMLSQDLNYHLRNNPDDRFVLFVDEYEGVFDEGGVGARWRENLFDRRVREFVRESNGLLVAFFSREKLPWADEPDWEKDLDGAEHLIGGLNATDADEWLQQVPIKDESVREAIIEGALEEPKDGALVYPLMLELQVEHWREQTARGNEIVPEHFHVAAKTFKARCGELVQRVLRDYGDEFQITLERLSVANGFDRAAFEHIVNIFATGLPYDSFERIAGLSFVTESESGILTIHRGIAEAIRSMLSEEKSQTSIEVLFEHYESRSKASSMRDVTDETIVALSEAAYLRRMIGSDGYVDWFLELMEPVQDAARYAAAELLWRESQVFLLDRLGVDHPDTAGSYNNIASNIAAQGRMQEAEPLLLKALEIRERVLGKEHPDTAESYNNVAYVLAAQGRIKEAEPLLLKALEINKRVLGKDHPDTATIYNNVASNLQAQGRAQEAEPLYGKALEIRERVLGEDHPDTASSYNSVASNLGAQGRPQEAEPLYGKALEIREKVLGEDHPETATSYNNVAYNLQAQGRPQEAEPLYGKALEISKRVLGEGHPDTASSYNSVASNLDAQGRPQEAEPLYRKALAIRERVLGEDHPATAASYNNVAFNLQAQGRPQEAEPLYRKALAIRERVLGEDHPSTAQSYNNVASNLQVLGRMQEAERLLLKALEINKRVLGEDNPDTAITYNNFASNLDAQGRIKEAEPLYRKALEIRERVLGEDHPATATSYNNVAFILQAQGRMQEAEPLLLKALEIRERVLGKEHPDTAQSYNNVASNLAAQGRMQEAEPLYGKALEINKRVLGEGHPHTATTYSNVASNLKSQGRMQEAEPLLRKAVEISERVLGEDHPQSKKFRMELYALRIELDNLQS